MSTNFTKANLRAELIKRRQSLSRDTVAARSAALVDQLEHYLTPAMHVLHCFLPLAGDNEPDLRDFIIRAISDCKHVYTTNPERRDVKVLTGGVIRQFSLSDNTKFDLIIVPMLGFSGSHRLGFGGGFYDRFLAKQPNAQKIGVCFKEFEISDLPVETHDQPLDQIITV